MSLHQTLLLFAITAFGAVAIYFATAAYIKIVILIHDRLSLRGLRAILKSAVYILFVPIMISPFLISVILVPLESIQPPLHEGLKVFLDWRFVLWLLPFLSILPGIIVVTCRHRHNLQKRGMWR